MLNILREVGILREEGKLHTKLVFRVRMLLVIALILVGITVFNVMFRGANELIVAVLLVFGYVAGFYLFSRMSVVQWNEGERTVEAGRMDLIGFGVLALYIVFEIGLRTFLKDFYPISATVFLLAGIAGTLLGRAIGTLIEIHRVYLATHYGA